MAYNEIMRNTSQQEKKNACDKMIEMLAKVIMKLGDGYHKDKLVKEAKSLLSDDTLMDVMDENELIGFDNGVFDLRTMEFRKGKPEDYVSITVGYDYPEPGSVSKQDIDDVYNVFRSPFDSDEMAEYILKTIA